MNDSFNTETQIVPIPLLDEADEKLYRTNLYNKKRDILLNLATPNQYIELDLDTTFP